ncbi:MAG: SPOR domain-containing protein [Gemmatimonadetes bacterium]|nr:SPOR domain-containing protein [Gemmatimonadota bacterium]
MTDGMPNAEHHASPSGRNYWEAEGRRLTDALTAVSSALVVGLDPDTTSRVAIGLAHGWRGRRGVAIGDLTGFAFPLYELAGGEDATGLTDCFRDGLSLNDVARPAHNAEGLFVLPAGTPPVATEEFFRHERWEKLIRGFERAGGLLLLIAPLGAVGLDQLAALTGGVIAVDVPLNRQHAYHLLGAAEAPVPALAPETSWRAGALARAGFPSGAARLDRPRKGWKRVVAIFAALAVLGIAAIAAWRARAWRARHAAPAAPALLEPGSTAPASTPPDTTPALLVVPKADTIPLNEPAAGADSVLGSPYAVNVVAANTVAGANSVLRDGEKAILLPAVTVSPVTLGGGTVWYQVIVGAYATRTDADDMLQLLRRRGVVRSEGGVVVRVPYALLVADGVSVSDAQAVVTEWRAKEIMAYALLQADGRVRVLAGAFETPAQAAPLAAQLRRAGVPATVVYRLGRML